MSRPMVLAYYFPDWHLDPRNEAWFGTGWTEWELARKAVPRFPGHRQPRVPSLGFRDESAPDVAAEDIALAADHGVDGFLVDYYWYEDGSYLSGALDDGLLQAPNRDRVEFALMWANHDLVDIFPYRHDSETAARVLQNGAIGRSAFEEMVEHIITAYFTQPNYLSVDGCPWFSIYEIGNFLAGMGGVDQARDALEWFSDRVRAAGFPGLHLDAVVWGFGVLPTAVTVADPAQLLGALGFRTATSYVWVHHSDVRTHRFPDADSERLRIDAFADYERLAETLPVPVYPNVTCGWDSSPRVSTDSDFAVGNYPLYPVWDQTPAEFKEALLAARTFLAAQRYEYPVLTINAWNEWTEGSYLLPDTTNGFAFLEAIREVFGTDAYPA